MSKRAPIPPEEVARLVAASAKYGGIDADLVAAVAAAEAPKAGNEADAVKRVKRKLHQLVGAYLDVRMPFADWLARIEAAGDDAARRAACREILAHHASTRERLAELDAFYAAVFADMPAPRRVADLACGLNPLARPFMPIPRDTPYFACDVHRPLVDFVAAALGRLGHPIETAVCNLLAGVPRLDADVVLILKSLPCLEQADRAAGRRLLAAIDAPLIVVSYPTASLGGARRGMAEFYEERFRQIVPRERFEIETRRFATELMFRLWRRPRRTGAASCWCRPSG